MKNDALYERIRLAWYIFLLVFAIVCAGLAEVPL